jgi:cobalt transporter subunit CbtB
MTATTQSTTTTRTTASISATRSKTLVAATMAAFLGVFMIWGVGFSHIAAAHNAAHDVRHSNGFPCH